MHLGELPKLFKQNSLYTQVVISTDIRLIAMLIVQLHVEINTVMLSMDPAYTAALIQINCHQIAHVSTGLSAKKAVAHSDFTKAKRESHKPSKCFLNFHIK